MVTGLTERSEYQFRVSAENKAGFGAASEPSDVFMAKPPYGKYSTGILKKCKLN